jgi:hypothetical protein
LAAALDQVRAWATDPAREALAAQGPEIRAGWVAGLQQLADAVAAASVTAVEVFDARGDGQTLHGAASTTAWLRGALGVTGAEATQRVRIARASRHLLAEPLERLGTGVITYDHLTAIEQSVRRLRSSDQPSAVSFLTDLAAQAPVADVRAAGRHLQFVTDPDGALAESERQFSRRYLTLAPLMDGMAVLDGLLDAESAALLNSALEPFLVPADAHDTRTASQRRADGLMQVVQSAADHALLPTIGGQRPQLQVVVDPRATPTSSVPPGRLDHAGSPGLLTPVAVGRIACDARLTALLVDTVGTVVDLGRTQRLFSARQRRLLAARDRGCRFPGCHRPPAHTDAHHVIPWLAGGPTDVANAILLCRHHHRLVHEGGWVVTAQGPSDGSQGTVTFTGPRGQRLASLPRPP